MRCFTMLQQILTLSALLWLTVGNAYAYTPTEDALLNKGIYTIDGTFGSYDFSDAEAAFDWAFTTANGTSYQLQGVAPTSNDLFGWKAVNITTPEPKWYMFSLGNDVDGDGSKKFDWVLLSANLNNKSVYKLAGVADNQTFKYSAKLDIDYSVNGNTITINNSNYTPDLMSAQECNVLAQQIIDYSDKLDNISRPGSDDISNAITAAKSNIDCKTVEGLVLYYYDNDLGYEIDDRRAVLLFREAAADGNAIAQAYLGRMYLNGYGTVMDYSEAKKWFEKSAAQNHADGQTLMGMLYKKGYAVTQEYSKAKEWYEKAALQGHHWGQNNLGWLYETGSGVTQSYTKAREWYEKSAAQGNATSQVDLGYLYRDGLGVQKNYSKANELFEKAVKKDLPYAKSALGYNYLMGWGVIQNYTKAKELFEEAAEHDDTMALSNLGQMYYYGEGVTQNTTMAIEYLERAANLGDEWAQNFLDDKNLRFISRPSKPSNRQRSSSFASPRF